MLHLTSAKTVGWIKYPVCPIRFPPHISFAPWDLPDSISSRILSIWTSSIWQQRQFTTSQWVHCMLRPRRRPALMASLARRRAHHRLGRPNKNTTPCLSCTRRRNDVNRFSVGGWTSCSAVIRPCTRPWGHLGQQTVDAESREERRSNLLLPHSTTEASMKTSRTGCCG